MHKVAYVGSRIEEIRKKVQEYGEVILTDYTLQTVIPDTEDIVVIDSKSHISQLEIVGRGTVGVVLSHNRQGLQCLMKNGVKCVTCGMSGRDTISMSGTEYGKTVTLGRRIVAVTGKIVEAGDFNFTTDDSTDDDCLMLVAAIVLLCGYYPEDKKSD